MVVKFSDREFWQICTAVKSAAVLVAQYDKMEKNAKNAAELLKHFSTYDAANINDADKVLDKLLYAGK